MEYKKEILNKLLDMYEKRGAFDKEASSLRAIQLKVKDVAPDYDNRYSYDTYKEVDIAIDKMISERLIIAERDNAGKYTKIKLNLDAIQDCYKKTERKGVPEQCEDAIRILKKHAGNKEEILTRIINDWNALLKNHKKLPYDLKYNAKRIDDVIRVISAILKLDKETYIRNFSTALFRDSKRFQREFQKCTENILFDYTDEIVEKNQILEFYNLYENPTFVQIKGNITIKFETSVINIAEIPDGIALPCAALNKIKKIDINASHVITVENLTTYHDSEETDTVHIYLGGYHNHTKQLLLEKIYTDNKACNYFHKGDLDVYGFLILENLKEKTHIPFIPLMMDISTLQKFYKTGIYKQLTETDKKTIEKKIHTTLCLYSDVLQFMLDNNCKVEQESIKAVDIIKQ